MLCDDLPRGVVVGKVGRRVVQEGGDIYTYMVDLLHCTAETNMAM